MSTPQPHRDPCAVCLAPHPARIAADGLRTQRAADGHPWTPPSEPVAPVAATNATYTPEMFGSLAECRICAATVVNRRASMERHTAWHGEGS